MKSSPAIARRRARQARLRNERSYHTCIATVTADVVQKPVRPLTEAAYGRMLQEWDQFATEISQDVSPLDLVTLKKFLKWYCDGRKGRLATGPDSEKEQRITQNSAYTCWKSFMTAWHRRTGDVFSKSIQNTIETLIYGGDNNWLNLRTARRPTRNFTLMDFQACVRQLWQNDWYDYRCEAYRIGLHLMMLMHIGTSARSAEYVMNLRYRDTMLYQVWFEDHAQPQLVIDLCRNHTKGLANLPRQQPEHLLYELVDLPFYYNAVAFFVASLLAVQGLRDFRSWSDVCAASKPPDRNFLCLVYTEDVRDRHVFTRYTESSERETKAATSLVNALGLLGQRTGFRDKPTPGAIRREALLQVDRHGYSINERMRHADHRNANTYGSYYQNAISTVDGQATYFGLEQQSPRLHELFRGFSIRRDHQYRPEVPSRLQGQMRSAERGTEGRTAIDQAETPQTAYRNRRRLKDKILREDRQSRTSEAGTDLVCIYESDFQQARRLMPERDRLADTLFEVGSLRGSQGIDLMNDLVSLFASQNSETYCVELNSSRSHCDTCGIARSAAASQDWWRHVYHCRKERSELVGGFNDFCFFCYTWIDHVDAWAAHADQHSHHMPLKCSLAMFRGAVLRPAWCPDCMSRTRNPGANAKRLTQFFNTTVWKAHMDKHVQELRSERHQCLHPRCVQLPSYATIAEYVAHRWDIHLIPAPDSDMNGSARWDKASDKDSATDKAYCAAAGLRSSDRPAVSRRIRIPPHVPVQATEGSASNCNAEHDQDCRYWADESPATPKRLSLSISSSSSCQQKSSCFPAPPPKVVNSKTSTFEVVIPPKPPGWDDVPLIDCIGCNDRSTDCNADCEEIASDHSHDRSGGSPATPSSRATSGSAKRSMYSEEETISVAGGIQNAISRKTEMSEDAIRRRKAITEMHARIRERRRPRIK